MAYVITQKCIGEVYATCVQVCPVDCIHYVDKMPEGYPNAGQAFMLIDPEPCIECSACFPECPIGAIVESEEDDPEWAKFNAELAAQFRGKTAPTSRDRKEPPLRSDNQIVNP